MRYARAIGSSFCTRVAATTARRSIAVLVIALLAPASGYGGPPYVTDDPEPVELHHWEFYLASQHFITRGAASGTAPHVEVNYGALPGLQLHVLARTSSGPTFYGARRRRLLGEPGIRLPQLWVRQMAGPAATFTSRHTRH